MISFLRSGQLSKNTIFQVNGIDKLLLPRRFTVLKCSVSFFQNLVHGILWINSILLIYLTFAAVIRTHAAPSIRIYSIYLKFFTFFQSYLGSGNFTQLWPTLHSSSLLLCQLTVSSDRQILYVNNRI